MNTLLAVDGSDNAYEAVHALKYLARSEQLTLLHALNVPRPAYPLMLPEMAEEIVSMAEEQNIDLIVMGARGLGPVKERLLGSVSHAVLHKTPCPVLAFH
jgi:nucleotide-binding universal stress UspA family protein